MNLWGPLTNYKLFLIVEPNFGSSKLEQYALQKRHTGIWSATTYFDKIEVLRSLDTTSYLPGPGVNRDQEGGSPRKRPFHCTSVRLTPASSSNVTTLGSQFLLVGSCVRASPCKSITSTLPSLNFMIKSSSSTITYFRHGQKPHPVITHNYRFKK